MDLIIRNGTVVDGTGAPPFRADVGIRAGKIATVGDLSAAQAERELDARGHMVAPGFIDIHTHADIALLARPTHEPKVMQGVTTEVFSNCGLGFAPVSEKGLAVQKEYLLGLFGDDAGVDWNWRSVGDFLTLFRGRIATNAAYLIPHGSVRVSAMGMADRPATGDELSVMTDLVRQGMDEGAWGLSTGLWYSPMSYAAPEENVALCEAVADRGGFFAIHMRDYSHNIIGSLEESYDMSQRSGAPLQVSHLQIGGAQNWGRAGEVLASIEGARRAGIDVTYDSYPYTAGSTLVQAMLPTWATVGGPPALLQRLTDPEERPRIVDAMNEADRDWTRHVLCGARSVRYRAYEGESFARIAEAEGAEIGELICRILLEDELQACFIAHLGNEGDLRQILKHPAQMIGSDGLHLPGKTHPRLFGAFPRLLARYVRDEGLLTLEEAVWKMTGFPAQRMGFRDRGLLREGLAADVVVFDPATVQDTATFDDPCRYPAGIPYVLVNGELVVEGGRHTGRLNGEVLTP
ncbi:MAG TPA: D-aminoacylase [Armatimonadota bacterium]|nr:D-aminoacylase [Armatimonadota bacterium]